MYRLSLVSLFAFAAPAFAQEEGREVRYNPRTEIDMDEVDVNAPIDRPSITFVPEIQRKAFPVLIRLRTDFDHELASSVDDVE